MTIGDRHIRGIIREREEAEQIYAEAKHQGYVASLMTQERPNIFTQSVANIEPGKAIDIALTYFNPLSLPRRRVRVRLPDGRRPALQPTRQHHRRRGRAARRQRQLRPSRPRCSI